MTNMPLNLEYSFGVWKTSELDVILFQKMNLYETNIVQLR